MTGAIEPFRDRRKRATSGLSIVSPAGENGCSEIHELQKSSHRRAIASFVKNKDLTPKTRLLRLTTNCLYNRLYCNSQYETWRTYEFACCR
jgi:hypothetical protein